MRTLLKLVCFVNLLKAAAWATLLKVGGCKEVAVHTRIRHARLIVLFAVVSTTTEGNDHHYEMMTLTAAHHRPTSVLGPKRLQRSAALKEPKRLQSVEKRTSAVEHTSAAAINVRCVRPPGGSRL